MDARPSRNRGRRLKPGLRARFVAAILLTSAVTLAAAAIALLSPLERSLRNDEMESLKASVQAARGTFAGLLPSDVAPGSPALRALALTLARRSEARVAIVDEHGAVLFNASADPALVGVARRALATHRMVSDVVGEHGGSYGLVAVRTRLADERGAVALRRSLNEAHSAVGVVQRAFVVASIIALAVGALLGAWLVTAQLRRVRRLRDAVNRIGEHGLEVDVPSDHAGDEVSDLTHSFRSMQGALRRQEDARKAFIATASHELRTPITSLHGMLELLDDDLARDNPDLGDARLQLAGARRQSARLVALARDLLDLSRLDAGSELRREPVELVEVARAVLAEFRPRAEALGVELALEAPGDQCWASADPGSVARIVRIVVDNALRYTPRGEAVRIAVDSRAERARITVSDRGPGIPPDERDVIFERFKRGSVRRDDDSGFGLGLAIGRELARQMGGDLELIQADAPGATFRVILPAEVPPGGEDSEGAVAQASAR